MTRVPEGAFELTPSGRFWRRFGPGGREQPYSQYKICLTATDPTYLAALLYDLSLRDDVYYVKYDARPRSGMWRGRCFALTDETAGALWRELRSDQRLTVSLQDDDLIASLRPSREGAR